MKLVLLFLMTFITLTSCGESNPPNGNVYVDAVNGDDGNSGSSSAKAWKSLEMVNNTSLEPGDTLFLKSGCLWNETLIFPSGGSRNRPVVITSYGSGPKPVIDGQRTREFAIYIYKKNFVEVNGLSIKNTVGEGSIRIAYGTGVIISNCDFEVTGHGAVLIENSSDCMISGNYITSPPGPLKSQTDGIYSQRNNKIRIENNRIILHNSQPDQHIDGIQSYLDGDLTISGNFIFQDNPKTNSQGIYATNAQGKHTYFNNIVYCPNTLASVIGFRNLDKGYGSLEIYNNTLKSKGSNNLYVTETQNVKAYNNIFVSTSAAYVINLDSRIDDISDSFDHNLYYREGTGNVINYPAGGGGMTLEQWKAKGPDRNSIMADPKLDSNLHPAAGSAAIDAGEDISAVSSDIDGKVRKKGKSVDIGAVEYQK